MACRRDFKHSLFHHVSLDSFFGPRDNPALARNCPAWEKSRLGGKVGLNGCLIVIPERYDCKQLKRLFYSHFNVRHRSFMTAARKAGDHVFNPCLHLSTPGSSVGGLPGGTLPVEMPFDATVVVGQARFPWLVRLDHRVSAVGRGLV